MNELVDALIDMERLNVFDESTRSSRPRFVFPAAKENVPEPNAPGLVTRKTPRFTATAPVKSFAELLSVQSAMPALVSAVAPEVLSPMLPAKVFVPALVPVRVSVLAPTPLTSRFELMMIEFATVL